MARIRLRFIQEWTDKKTGITFRYFRRPGCKRVAHPGLPGSTEFMSAYQAALDAPRPSIGEKRSRSGTVGATIAAYYLSLNFAALSAGTQQMRRAILERFRNEHGDKPIELLPSKFIVLTLNKLKPHAARNWFKAIRHLMAFAVSIGACRIDPTQGVKLPKAKSKEHRAWTDAEVTAYEKVHPIGSKARLAFAIGYYTAQRRGDAIRTGRQHISDDGFIQVRQDKTDALLDIPLHPRLRTIIAAAAPTDHLTFLITKSGRPYSANDFSEQFPEWCDAAELPKDCHFHGLRYSAAKLLAEAACTPHQIAAITGHKTLAMVEKYSKAADQRRLASEAMAKLVENSRAT